MTKITQEMNKIITFDAVYRGKKYHREVVRCPERNCFIIVKDEISDA